MDEGQQSRLPACRKAGVVGKHLAGDGGVGVQHVLEVLEDLLVLGAQPRHPQPQARPVLCDLALRCAQRLQQEFPTPPTTIPRGNEGSLAPERKAQLLNSAYVLAESIISNCAGT